MPNPVDDQELKGGGVREQSASPPGSGYSGYTPSPQAVSASGEYPSREAREIIHEISDLFPASDPDVGFTPFEDWYLRLWRALRDRGGEVADLVRCEREACAYLAETHTGLWDNATAEAIASAIRARGSEPDDTVLVFKDAWAKVQPVWLLLRHGTPLPLDFAQVIKDAGFDLSRNDNSKRFADAICDGYPVVRDDAFVRVENPRYQPDNGESPYITAKAHDAVRVLASRIDIMKMDHAAELERLMLRLINGPANPQECAEFCRVAREDGDGKPCLDCHPENFHF